MISNRKNAIVGQSGGPTSAINSTLAGVIDAAIKSDHIDTLYGAFNGLQGMLDERICDLSSLFSSEEDILLLRQTPAAALGSCRLKLKEPDAPEGKETYEKLFAFFEKHSIGYFFYIGGNDSMDTVSKLSRYAEMNSIKGINFIGVPKTIDNDLVGTDHTPGFGSAAKYIATTMLEILRDTAVYTVKAVTIVEIMGRDAGWLTASSALAGAVAGVSPDLIYLPESVFDLDTFISDVKKALDKHPNVVVAVSEGIRFADGRYVGEGTQSGVTDVFGHKYLQGTAKALEMEVKNAIGCKTRSVELSLPQRCAAHITSYNDIEESFNTGRAAVEFAKNNTASMVCMKRGEPYSISYELGNVYEIANKIKLMPPEYIDEKNAGVTDACIDYLMPLIQGEWNVIYKNGLPVHKTIER